MDQTTQRDGDDEARRSGNRFDVSKALRWAGVGLLGATGVLVWKEVAMDAVYLLLGWSLVTLTASALLERVGRRMLGPALTLSTLVLGAGWYGATREPLALVALAVSALTFAGIAVVHRARSARSAHRTFALHGAAWASVALSLALDFHVFHAVDLGSEDFVARRVLLTLLWLTPGLAALVYGGKREDRGLQSAGAVLTLLSLGKVVLYDTAALEGVLRIAVYGAAGALTLLAGQLLTRKAPVVVEPQS